MPKLRNATGQGLSRFLKGADRYPVQYPAFARATSTSPAPGHPIRIALADLQTLDEVRIMEGKA